MKKMIQAEFYKLLHSWNLYIALAVGTALSIWCLYMNCIAHKWQLEMMSTANVVYYYPLSVFNSYIGIDFQQLASSIFYVILPLLAVIPYGASLAGEIKNGYVKNVFVRNNRTVYYWAKIVIAFISGAFVVLFTMLFSLISTAMFLPALPPIIASNSFPGIDTSTTLGTLYLHHPLLYILGYIVFDSLFLGVFAAMGTAIAIYSANPFFAMCGPFVVFNLISYVFSYMPSSIKQMMPNMIIRQAGGYVKSIPSMLIMLIGLTTVTVILYWKKVRDSNDML